MVIPFSYSGEAQTLSYSLPAPSFRCAQIPRSFQYPNQFLFLFDARICFEKLRPPRSKVFDLLWVGRLARSRGSSPHLTRILFSPTHSYNFLFAYILKVRLTLCKKAIMDIQEQVIKFLSEHPSCDRSAVRIEGVSQEDVENVLKHLAMSGRLNQVNGMVNLSGK